MRSGMLRPELAARRAVTYTLLKEYDSLRYLRFAAVPSIVRVHINGRENLRRPWAVVRSVGKSALTILTDRFFGALPIVGRGGVCD